MIFTAFVTLLISGCGQKQEYVETQNQIAKTEQTNIGENEMKKERKIISIGNEIMELEEGLSTVRFDGNYGFDEFLSQGGAEKDSDVISYLTSQVLIGVSDIRFNSGPFGCSTLSVKDRDVGYLYGRNFDWDSCNAMIVSSKPDTGYASVSTVNMNFIQTDGVDISIYPDKVQAMIALYAPIDGMNEQGFTISVNMIEDSAKIEQNTDKIDLTTTTSIRLLLNQASNVDEAIELLNSYDLHDSMGMMIHFSMADATGRSVVVEYVNQEMIVTDTPIVTNFYLSQGSKYGIGSNQSHMRYDILEQKLKETPTMNEEEVKDAMNSVSKDNFNEFESTEWTIIMNQETKELTYYHRENYENSYTFRVE